jgi:Calcium binding
MKRPKRDPVREDRIHNEAIVDASPDEQAMSWYYYLESKISFPFHAKCLTTKVKPSRSCAWHRTESASTTCSSSSDGRVEPWPPRSLTSPLSIQTNQPRKPLATGITGWRRVTASEQCRPCRTLRSLAESTL